MSWIRRIPPEEAAPVLAAPYDRARAGSSRGEVSNVWQACGLDPAGLGALLAYRDALLSDPAPLTVAQAELLAVVVSATNGCGYCVAHHGPRLARALGDPDLARAVAGDYRAANLAARDRVLLDYAVALTCEPEERTLDDVERLREYGFDDSAILRTTQIAAYFNLVNRLASALGVALEAGVPEWSFGGQQ